MSTINEPANHSLPFSEACERNKAPILDVLKDHLPTRGRVLEIGAGTGQHAVYFAEQFSGVQWHPTDTGDYMAGLRARIAAQAPANMAAVAELDVRFARAPAVDFAAVYSANTLHFMSVSAGEAFIDYAASALLPDGVLIVYGPFKYGGAFTVPSNARFDEWLKSTDQARGVRDFEWVNALAAQAGLVLQADVPMPANNQCLIWRKLAE